MGFPTEGAYAADSDIENDVEVKETAPLSQNREPIKEKKEDEEFLAQLEALQSGLD